MPSLDQIILTAPDGGQTLIDLWDNGAVEVSHRPEPGAGWVPSEIVGTQVRVLRNVQ